MSNSLKSMLHRVHQQQNAQFVESNGSTLVGTYTEDDKSNYQKLGLADLTSVLRIGFKGKDTPNWLESQNIDLPSAPNQAVKNPDGTLIAKLSNNEYLFLSDLHSASKIIPELEKWQLKADRLCYLLHRVHSHSWFMLTGEHSIEMMAKVCGVDLRDGAFPNLSVAQTSVARLSAIVIKDEVNGVCRFHLLSDSASSEYAWSCLLDAMLEYDGKPIGINAVNKVA